MVGVMGPGQERTHGRHTLRVSRGVVVGRHGDDVFVQLGPRSQGVISVREFGQPPSEGDEFEFTLGGREEDLWVLSLAEAPCLPSWEDMELGCLVPARVRRATPDGLQVEIGRLHAFMPRSQSGLARGKKLETLVGRTLNCEVIEIDPAQQRVVLSRKKVQQRERRQQQRLDRFQLGQVVRGRVTRIEPYGVFVALGHGREGLIHVSNLAHEHVEDPSEVVAPGETVEAKVLFVRRGGDRIGLGVKQLEEDPWQAALREHYAGQLVEVTVCRVAEFGVFCTLRAGVDGLLPNAETGEGARRARELLKPGDRPTVRIVEFDPDAQRLTLSLTHPGGGRIAPGEADQARAFADWSEASESGSLGQDLGTLLRGALDEKE